MWKIHHKWPKQFEFDEKRKIEKPLGKKYLEKNNAFVVSLYKNNLLTGATSQNAFISVETFGSNWARQSLYFAIGAAIDTRQLLRHSSVAKLTAYSKYSDLRLDPRRRSHHPNLARNESDPSEFH